MKNFMHNRGHLVAVLIVFLFSLFLVACGGGGGGGSSVTPTPTPTTFTETIVCPSGESKSGTSTTQSAALDAAIAQCPALVVTSTTPANGDTSASPVSIAANGIVVATTSMLAAQSNADVKLTSGTITYPGVTTLLPDGKSFKFVPTATLPYAQVFNFVSDCVKNGLGKCVKLSISFTTASAPFSCAFPMVKHVSKDACIYPKDVQKAVPAVELAASITKVTDAGFITAMGNGDVLLFDTDIKMTNTSFAVADRTRALVSAHYRQGGKYFTKFLFKDTLTGTVLHDDSLTAALFGAVYDRIESKSDGVHVRQQPSGECGVYLWDDGAVGFVGRESKTCSVWN